MLFRSKPHRLIMHYNYDITENELIDYIAKIESIVKAEVDDQGRVYNQEVGEYFSRVDYLVKRYCNDTIDDHHAYLPLVHVLDALDCSVVEPSKLNVVAKSLYGGDRMAVANAELKLMALNDTEDDYEDWMKPFYQISDYMLTDKIGFNRPDENIQISIVPKLYEVSFETCQFKKAVVDVLPCYKFRFDREKDKYSEKEEIGSKNKEDRKDYYEKDKTSIKLNYNPDYLEKQLIVPRMTALMQKRISAAKYRQQQSLLEP